MLCRDEDIKRHLRETCSCVCYLCSVKEQATRVLIIYNSCPCSPNPEFSLRPWSLQPHCGWRGIAILKTRKVLMN